MAEAIKTVDMNTLGSKLAETAEQLQQYCSELGDMLTGTALEKIRRRLGHGLIRIALVGKTSSGKSALVNALVQALIVPENPNTSSPIPVWICRQEGEGVSIEVYRREMDASGTVQQVAVPCTLEEFLTRYCYSVSDVNDQKRERFLHVDHAVAGLSSPVLENGVVLVDTLGISATTVDSAKTIAVLNDEIDLVVYLTREPQMKTDEVAFLQKHVLGCHPDAVLDHPVPPEQVLFVYNNFNPHEPHNRVAFAKSVADVLAPMDLAQERVEAIAHSQTFYVNALMARLARCGYYPYGQYAPAGSTPAEQAALARREKRDRDLAQRMDPAELLEKSGVEQLAQGLTDKAAQLTRGERSVAGKRIGTLVDVAHSIKLTANQSLAAANLTLDSLEKKKSSLRAFETDSEQKRHLIRQGMQALERAYRESFVRLFQNRQEAILQLCALRVFQMPCPDGFMKYADFRRMEDQAKAEYLLPHLRDISQQAIATIKEQVKAVLDIEEGTVGEMPLKVLGKAQKQITDEMTAFNARVEKLRQDGLDALGVHLPQPHAVEEMFASFKVDLEKQIMDSIETAMSAGGKAYMEQLEQCVDQVRSNLIVNLFPQLLSRESFWDLMLEKAAGPMLVILLTHLIELMQDASVDGIGRATHLAFEQTADEINSSYVRLQFSLEAGIAALEKQLERQEPMNQELAQRIEQIKLGCDEVTQSLLTWQQELS